MGATRWSEAAYADRATLRATTKAPVFEHSSKIEKGEVEAKTHARMDAKNKIRECRDSETHPEARPVAAGLDVTGSMRHTPVILQASLCKLLGLILRKGYLTDLAILISAFGDAYQDRAPLQIGQFESGIEIENDLQRLYLEGGGGTGIHESSELFLYFLANKVVSDAWEKRRQKGYAFIITDELPYPQVCGEQVAAILGDQPPADILTAEVVEQVREKWELFVITPNMTANWNLTQVSEGWRDLVGQNYLRLEEPSALAELIACQIGCCEGVITTPDRALSDMVDEKTAPAEAERVSRSLRYTSSRATASV